MGPNNSFAREPGDVALALILEYGDFVDHQPRTHQTNYNSFSSIDSIIIFLKLWIHDSFFSIQKLKIWQRWWTRCSPMSNSRQISCDWTRQLNICRSPTHVTSTSYLLSSLDTFRFESFFNIPHDSYQLLHQLPLEYKQILDRLNQIYSSPLLNSLLTFLFCPF